MEGDLRPLRNWRPRELYLRWLWLVLPCLLGDDAGVLATAEGLRQAMETGTMKPHRLRYRKETAKIAKRRSRPKKGAAKLTPRRFKSIAEDVFKTKDPLEELAAEIVDPYQEPLPNDLEFS